MTIYSILLWLQQDILTEATAAHSVEPKQIFRDTKESHCSNQQMYAVDASTGQDFGPLIYTQTLHEVSWWQSVKKQHYWMY